MLSSSFLLPRCPLVLTMAMKTPLLPTSSIQNSKRDERVSAQTTTTALKCSRCPRYGRFFDKLTDLSFGAIVIALSTNSCLPYHTHTIYPNTTEWQAVPQKTSFFSRPPMPVCDNEPVSVSEGISQVCAADIARSDGQNDPNWSH